MTDLAGNNYEADWSDGDVLVGLSALQCLTQGSSHLFLSRRISNDLYVRSRTTIAWLEPKLQSHKTTKGKMIIKNLTDFIHPWTNWDFSLALSNDLKAEHSENIYHLFYILARKKSNLSYTFECMYAHTFKKYLSIGILVKTYVQS